MYLGGAAIAVMAVPAAAQSRAQIEARTSRVYKDCMAQGAAARGVTSGMMDCLGSEIDRQDARLNQAYRMVMTRLSATRRATLRASERRWISTRDAGCRRAAAPYENGTAGTLTYSSCILDETIKRTMWIERYRG